MRNGSWELITQRFPSQISRIYDQDEVYGDGLDGNVHWICYTGVERDRQTLVAFDLGVTTFNEMSLLDFIQECQNVLGLLAGKLCAMSCINAECEVWVMGEYGWLNHGRKILSLRSLVL